MGGRAFQHALALSIGVLLPSLSMRDFLGRKADKRGNEALRNAVIGVLSPFLASCGYICVIPQDNV